MIINSPFPKPIAQTIREFMSMWCGALFVIDKMSCGILRVRWCDIVLIAYLSTEGKPVFKMTVYISKENSYFLTL